jgi:ureidoacrylate peracid hydrolase
MLRTLSQKVDPQHAAILLVDVQNDFCAEGGALHREGMDLALVQAMIPRLERFVEVARASGVRCIWIRNVYNTAPNWYLSEVWLEQAERTRNGLYVKHPVCQAGEWNGDFYKIRPREEKQS